jgi:hypothetical protein
MMRIECNMECPICEYDISFNESFTTRCLHKFHKNCLAEWCNESNSCPCCYALLVRPRPPCAAMCRNGFPCGNKAREGFRFCWRHL